MPAHLQNIGILSELFDRFISGSIDPVWFYRSIRKRRNYEHYYTWLMGKQNKHLTSLRLSIIKNYFLEYKISILNKKVISEEEINIIRDSALKVERVDLTTALDLMRLALHFRPKGRGIQGKIIEYESNNFCKK